MRHRFDPPGSMPLAMPPHALVAFYERAEPSTHEMRDGVAVVRIKGPLAHHAGWWCDSYDAIRERVAHALAARPAAGVLLVIDSPGGECSGLFEAARELRAMADEARVPLVAHVEGYATSAAYALACSADRITSPETSILGSIGVITARWDESAALERHGLRVDLITSGARKADGASVAPMSEAERAAAQGLVDDLAGLFFAWVAERRPALTADAVRGLEAGIALGRAAVASGLADAVETLDQTIAAMVAASRGASIRAQKPTSRGAHRARTEMHAMTIEELREMLGLPEDATEEQVREELQKRLAPAEEADEGEMDAASDEAEKAKEEAAALAKKLAAEATATATLRDRVVALEAEVSALRPLAAEKAQRDREAAVDEAMGKRGMKGHASRARFVDLAEKHGLEAALAAIDAAHVPPSGSPIPAGAHASRDTSAPEAALGGEPAQGPTAEQRKQAQAIARERYRADQSVPQHVHYKRALAELGAR